ncbi:Light-sensor Protein kinase [Puccinia graminis f. sp. tritici]|uniref:Light-sensor Protein kinase n=1 Tax=Puccinia graminis f. sp. tritici TaxID=56615 RepID=A0A5B0N7X3_PUCGR|nr:Light-sensor Protein kinase [Puccinia graminis f. sp. tritici]
MGWRRCHCAVESVQHLIRASLAKSHNLAESTEDCPRVHRLRHAWATNDGPSKTKQVTPKKTFPEGIQPKPKNHRAFSTPPHRLPISLKKIGTQFASKIERPSIHTITEPGEPSSSTLTPSVQKRLQADDNKPLSPNPVQHISDYQKPNRNQTPAKQPMKSHGRGR